MLGFSYVLLAGFFWALDTLFRYPLIKSGVSASAIVYFEHIILSLIFLKVFLQSYKKIWNAKTSHYFYFFVIGGIGSAISTLAFTRAFYFLNPSLVILLQKFQPIIAIGLASIVLKEKISKNFLFWSGVCLVGAFLVGSQDFYNLFQTSSGSITRSLFHEDAFIGYSLVFISVLGWGASTVYGKKLILEGYSNNEILAGRFTMGLITLTPFIIYFQENLVYSGEVYWKTTAMVLVSGLLSMFIYYKGLKIIPARLASLGEMFFPLMAIIVNWIFLGEGLTLIQLIGGGVLLVGAVTIQHKKY